MVEIVRYVVAIPPVFYNYFNDLSYNALQILIFVACVMLAKEALRRYIGRQVAIVT